MDTTQKLRDELVKLIPRADGHFFVTTDLVKKALVNGKLVIIDKETLRMFLQSNPE